MEARTYLISLLFRPRRRGKVRIENSVWILYTRIGTLDQCVSRGARDDEGKERPLFSRAASPLAGLLDLTDLARDGLHRLRPSLQVQDPLLVQPASNLACIQAFRV